MQADAQHFVLLGPVLDPSALETIKQHVSNNRTLLFIVWYDPHHKGDPHLARLASDLATCDVLFRPMPAFVPAEVMSEYSQARSWSIVPWASASDMMRAWTLEKGGDAAAQRRP